MQERSLFDMKKKSRLNLLWLAVFVLSLLLCSSAFAARLSPDVLAEFNAIGIGTSSLGAAFYVVGGGFANVWQELGVRAAVEITGGSLQNCILVGSGQVKSALISQATAYQSWKSEGMFAGQPPQENLRAALPIQSSYIHGWTLDPNILTYRDLGDRIVSGGPAGGTSEEYNKAILEGLGITPRRFINAGFTDTTGQLGDGLLDAVFCSLGIPAGAAAEAAATLGARLIGVHPDDFAKTQEILPFLIPSEIPAGTYAGQTEAFPTFADLNVYFFHKDVPEYVVYRFVKQSFESKEMLVNTFAGLVAMDPDNVRNIIMPLHPGAYRYYREIGAYIPENIIPR
jgi:hypothetical protein